MSPKKLLKLTSNLISSLPIDNFVSVEFSDNDLTHYKAIIKGPIDSPFQNALFTLDVSYPDDYPFKPPKVKFDDKIFHPNVDLNTGKISLDILSDQWSPALTFPSGFVLSVCSLLSDPNPDDPINFEAAKIFKEDEQSYNNIVKSHIRTNINEYSSVFKEVSKLLEPLSSHLFNQEIQIQTAGLFSKLVEKRRLKKEKEQLEELKTQYERESREFQELHHLVFPKSPYNFSQLWSEVQRLKIQDLVSQIDKQEKKLDEFVQQLRIGREKVRELCRVYQKLIRIQSQEIFDPDAVMLLEDEIDKIKDKLLSGGWFTWKVSLENTWELCHKCEKIAKLRVEQAKLCQQPEFQAQQEIPPHNNN